MPGSQHSDQAVDRARGRQRTPVQTQSNYGGFESDNSDSASSKEYYLITRADYEGPTNNHPAREPVEPYHFPGTWSRAAHDTTEAVKEVVSASKEYASAVAKSGIGKASYSVGSALAATANRGAVMAAGLAINASGTDQRKLPGIFQRWLKTDKVEAAKRKKEKAKHVVETMPPSRATSIASRRSRGRQDDQYEAVMVPNGGVFRSRRASDDDGYSMPGAGLSPNRAHADAIFTTQQTSAARHQFSSAAVRRSPLPPANEESPYANANDYAYFGGPAMSAGWVSRRQSLASMGPSSRPAVCLSPLAVESKVEVKFREGEEKEDEDDEDESGGMENMFEEE